MTSAPRPASASFPYFHHPVTEHLPAVPAAHKPENPVASALQGHMYSEAAAPSLQMIISMIRSVTRFGSIDDSLSLCSPFTLVSFEELFEGLAGALPEIAHVDSCEDYLLTPERLFFCLGNYFADVQDFCSSPLQGERCSMSNGNHIRPAPSGMTVSGRRLTMMS
jgi:hypothetical protein